MHRPRSLTVEQLENRRLLAFNPTAQEQELLQLVNRFRTDPRGEFVRLFSSAAPLVARDPVLQADIDFARVNGATLRNELQALSPVPPVAWNEAIYNYSNGHNARMIAAKQAFHSDSLQRREALLAAGVNLRFAQGEVIHSENVFGQGKSPMHIYGGYMIDWGAGGPGGMQSGRPHRQSIGNADFEQIGHRISSFTGGSLGPLVNTQVLANIENPPAMVVGAVFEDKNSSGWYEAGEGIGSVSIVFEGSAGTFTASSLAAGGYQVELPPGTYQATATGGGMKHAVVVKNIVVNSTNVWRNLIYDPTAIPPDSREANNSTSTATVLESRDQTLSGLSIHIASDVDYFKFVPAGSGNATIRTQFIHANGDLSLQLLNANGAVLATSATAANGETITQALVRGSTYFVKVYGAPNGNYSLTIDGPEPAPPVANADQGVVSNDVPTTTMNILANDTDPDGSRTNLLPTLAANAPSSFTLNSNHTVSFRAPAGFSGVQRTTYTVTDDQGLRSAATTIQVFVIDFTRATPWKNRSLATDVSGDGVLTAVDALLVINELNSRGSRALPTSGNGDGILGFVDTDGSGFISAVDVLLVVNALNASGSGEAEGPATAMRLEPEAIDEGLRQMFPVEESTKKHRDAFASN